jgi:hypothetical protein
MWQTRYETQRRHIVWLFKRLDAGPFYFWNAAECCSMQCRLNFKQQQVLPSTQ